MQQAGRTPPARILIIGGGTAGWMAATLLAHRWKRHSIEITLLESADIGIIGVGEGSTPRMREFFARLGIPENEWMPACNATYKCGIRFPDWSTRKGFQSYYHPFFTLDDKDFVQTFFHNTELRRKNVAVHAHPDAFFVSNYLAENSLAPIPGPTTDYETQYAYHFDANLIGRFLKKKAMEWGVRHVVDTVVAVNRHDSGDLKSVDTNTHGTLEADFFVDCTGFAGVLIGRTLDVPFISFEDVLFNDRAVALPTPLEEGGKLPSQTVSSALKHGWVWKIPLSNRFGNGYVYSSAFCTAEDAERELRAHIGLHDESVEARHLKMRIGRRERCWDRNCLAVGLSQGFIEPLEATALFLVQETIESFIKQFEAGDFTARNRDKVNAIVNCTFEGVKSYIFMHYKLNSRNDTEYWIANRENPHGPDLARELISVWDDGGDILGALNANKDWLIYSHTSWICILAGMGRFPRKARKPKPKMQYARPELMREATRRLGTHFPDHRRTIEALPRHEAPVVRQTAVAGITGPADMLG